MHDRDTPVVDGRGEAGHVGDHPPADGHDHVGPGQAPPGEVAAERFDRFEILGRLAVVEKKGALLDAGVHRPGNGSLGDDRGPVGSDREHLGQAVAGAGPDQDRVGAVAEVDAEFMHRVRSLAGQRSLGQAAATIRSTTCGGDSRSTSKVRSASSA